MGEVGGAGATTRGGDGGGGGGAYNARANTGGGGAGRNGNTSGAGGSGIVIIRYVAAASLTSYEQWRRDHFNTAELADLNVSGDDADPDTDGMSNLDEYWAGTNPTDPLSVLLMTESAIRNLPFDPAQGSQQSEIVIHWQSVSNKLYTLQAATNLPTGFNLILGSNIFATPPENVHTDSVSGVGCRFYRVRVE